MESIAHRVALITRAVLLLLDRRTIGLGFDNAPVPAYSIHRVGTIVGTDLKLPGNPQKAKICGGPERIRTFDLCLRRNTPGR